MGEDHEGYFHRVHRLTPTRFWINNPTIEEARKAIAAGAVACTTNPTYAAKMAASTTDRERFAGALSGVAGTDTASAARKVQRHLVAPLVELFAPLYRESRGALGFVSIQGSPFDEQSADAIVEQAREDRMLGPNVIAKIPVTEAGLRVIELLVAEDVPIIATEVMSIDQAIAACEAYERAARAAGRRPAFFVTHITGIFDAYLAELAARGAIDVDRDILQAAGIAVARKQLRVMRERSYAGTLLGGGARALSHFTELVGENAHVTINWKGAAEELVAQDGPVVARSGCPVPDSFIDELTARVPDFRRAYYPGALTLEEFAEFGPVALFRRSFEEGWQNLLDELAASGAGSLAEAGARRNT